MKAKVFIDENILDSLDNKLSWFMERELKGAKVIDINVSYLSSERARGPFSLGHSIVVIFFIE